MAEEDVLGVLVFVAAADLDDGAEDFAGDVDAAVAGEDEGGGGAGFHRRAVDDGGAGEAEVDQLSVDV
jgi:hypothetical protein